jgi:D-alanyl-D-alanine carboxypeptidase
MAGEATMFSDSTRILAARADRLCAQLSGAADEMVRQGLIGVAARIDVPGLAEPLQIASGHRDIERSAPLIGTELFAIASQSKMFTAAMVVRLAKDGVIALTDPVARYVADIPAVDDTATIEQFLNHTSGIGNFIRAMTTLPYPWPRMSYDDLMGLARMQGRQFSAGARFDYNNTDVVVLARLCELVAGASMSDLLRRYVFTPLGMHDTYVAAGEEWPRTRMARGYYLPTQGYDGAPVDVATLPDFSIASAAGNVVSSLPDLLRWAESLLTGEALTGISFADVATSVAESRGLEPSWFFPRAYGRGVERWSWAGRHFWGHRGSFFGYHSGTFLDPVSGAAFSMFLTMCTSGSFMRFIDLQAHDYMSFIESCAHAIVCLTDLP